MKDKNKPYDLNLSQHQNHKRNIPWLAIFKFLIAIGMIVFIYLYIQELITQKKGQVIEEQTTIEGIEILED